MQDVLSNRNITVPVGDIPYVLGIAGKYLYQRENLKPRKLKKSLKDLASRLTPKGNLKYKELIDKIASGDNKKVPINEIEYISITESEIKVIDNLKTSSEKRVAFTLLCLAKYRNEYIENNSGWETFSFSDIFSMANCNLNSSDRARVINSLVTKELIKPSKKITNCNYQVLFIDEDENAEIVMKITDFRDLGNTVLFYFGDDFDRCEICGRLIKYKPKTKHRKYCFECKDKFAYATSNNMYVPINERPVITHCSICGSEMHINPSLFWLGNICENCMDAEQ